MSGHSKWSTIKRQKGAADAKRGQVFTKLSNAITVAVKQSGGETNPESNFKLRLAIDRARGANMPKENIERAIKRAQATQGGNLEELLYEGFGPGGVGVLVEAVTDNKQRTFSAIKNVFDKNGGTLGSSGSVSYLFKKRGELVAKKNGLSSDKLLSSGIEAGVDDMEEAEDLVLYYLDPSKLSEAKQSIESSGLEVVSAEIVWLPSSYIAQDKELSPRALTLMERLEDLDDVQKVYTNLEVS